MRLLYLYEVAGRVEIFVCMYVCIELALGGLPMESGQWEGPIGIMGTISQSRGTIETASLTQVCTNTKSVSGPVCYCTS